MQKCKCKNLKTSRCSCQQIKVVPCTYSYFVSFLTCPFQKLLRRYCTSIYPNAGVSMFLSLQAYILPHALLLTLLSHPVIEAPKPMHELHELQMFPLLATNPIRTYILLWWFPPRILNPCLLQSCCRDESAISNLHFDFATFVGVNFPAAITLNSELALWWIAIHDVTIFVPFFAFIPRHIFLNGVFQYEASFVCFSVKPSSPSLTS